MTEPALVKADAIAQVAPIVAAVAVGVGVGVALPPVVAVDEGVGDPLSARELTFTFPHAAARMRVTTQSDVADPR